ncbi:MAG: tetratricopeptide repeat protein [Bacteroidales bacterium]|nr:tetratricopeptide repeat protein [Bacteroidales bacterium]
MKTSIKIMTRFVLLFIIGFSMVFETKAQNPEESLRKANSLYNENAFDSALVVYKDIVEQGYSSATLYYNIGNTYYKLRNYPLAIYYYEKSLKLDPNNDDTKHNIEIAQLFLTDKIEAVPELFIKTWWNNFSNTFTLNTWSIITLVLIGLLLTCIFFYITAKTRGLKKSMFFTGILLIVLTICSFSISAKKHNYISTNNEGIVIIPTITIKSSPSNSSVDLFVLHEGSKVKILDNTDGWEKIKIANGSIGWLPASSIIKY